MIAAWYLYLWQKHQPHQIYTIYNFALPAGTQLHGNGSSLVRKAMATPRHCVPHAM
jgi:hypothetical protein